MGPAKVPFLQHCRHLTCLRTAWKSPVTGTSAGDKAQAVALKPECPAFSQLLVSDGKIARVVENKGKNGC